MPAGAGSIGRTAHAWGFKDARHFARRFRDAYHLSPAEWQQINARQGDHEPPPAEG